MTGNHCVWLSGLVACAACWGCSNDTGGAASSTGTASASSTTIGSNGATTNSGTGTTETASATTTTGIVMPGWCLLQGSYAVTIQSTLKPESCTSITGGPTSYDATIEGTSITLVQPIERVPMQGTIDGDCHVQVSYSLQELSRSFDWLLDANTLTGRGTYDESDQNCAWSYDMELALSPSS